MPNELTGEFDAAVQVGVEGLNLVLAAQHQEGRYLHRVRLRVPPEGDGRADGVQGIAEVQVSTPTVTLPSGSASRVSAHYEVMVRMRRFADSVEVPEFIHGELQVSVDADRVSSEMGEHIRLDLGADDVDVAFTPDSGSPLPPEQRRPVDEAIDHFMRQGFEPLNQRIRFPRDGEFAVRHWRFKTLPDGAPPASALLLNLRDREPSGADLDGITDVFLEEGEDFALAVGADFLLPELRRMIREALAAHLDGLRVRVGRRFLPDCRYTVDIDLDGIEVQARGPRRAGGRRDGSIDITIHGRANGNRWSCPDYSFSVGQAFSLRPSADGGDVRLVAVGDPRLEVSGLFAGIVEGRIEGRAAEARDRIVREAQPVVDEIFGSLDSFREALDVASLHLDYRDIDISRDGVVVRGRFGVDWRDVVATFDRRMLSPSPPERPEPELELDAFRSWIPGGTVERYRWLHASERVVAHEIVEEHRYLTRVLQRLLLTRGCVWPPCRWCLEVRGTQGRTRSGRPREVVGWNCNIVSGGIVDIPRGWGTGSFRLPVEVLDPSGELVGHVDPWSSDGGSSGRVASGSEGGTTGHRAGGNLIVHFAGNSGDAPSVVGEIVARHDDDKFRLFGLVVVEPGADRHQEHREGQNGRLAWAEDFEGGWAKAFQVAGGPVTFLLDARGELVWRQEAPLQPEVLEKALDEHLQPTGRLRHRLLRLAVREEERAPDFLFEYGDGERMAARTLRGAPLVLSFWTTWSEPSLARLRTLRELHDELASEGLVVLAINDGEPREWARERLEKEGLPFQFVPDPERRIARLFGVRAWPTTVLIAADRSVRRIEYGLPPDPASLAEAARSCARAV